jgi:hypothetical protein
MDKNRLCLKLQITVLIANYIAIRATHFCMDSFQIKALNYYAQNNFQINLFKSYNFSINK